LNPQFHRFFIYKISLQMRGVHKIALAYIKSKSRRKHTEPERIDDELMKTI